MIFIVVGKIIKIKYLLLLFLLIPCISNATEVYFDNFDSYTANQTLRTQGGWYIANGNKYHKLK